jgi:hypothetical protein
MTKDEFDSHHGLLKVLREADEDASLSESIKSQAEDYYELVLKALSSKKPLPNEDILKMRRFVVFKT